MTTPWRQQPTGLIKWWHLIDTGYVPGSIPAAETSTIVPADKRLLRIHGAPADQEYTAWAYAYRDVDPDIDPLQVMKSPIALAPSSPNLPESEASFTGNLGDTPVADVVGKVDGIEDNADVTANAQSTQHTPDDVVIQEDYQGNTSPSTQYPLVVSFTRQRGSVDVTGSSNWAISAYNGGLNSGNTSINNTPGDPNIGQLTITGGIGSVIVQSTRGTDAVCTGTFTLTANKAPPPTNNTTSAFANITSTSDTILTSVLNQIANGTSISCQAASLAFWIGSPTTYGVSTCSMKWQYSLNGTTGWTDLPGGYVADSSGSTAGGVVKGTPYSGSPGSITCNQTQTGLTNGVLYYFRLVGKSSSTPGSPGYPIQISGSASCT